MNPFPYQNEPGQPPLDAGGSQDQFSIMGGQPVMSTTSAPPTIRKKSSDAGVGQSGNASRNSTAAGKKRTKTGCLTCRKRRIKCGEERPTCNNCVKSKRVCEGYNQRVVFKVGGFRNPSGDGHDGTGIMGMTSPTGTFDPNLAAFAGTARYPYAIQPARGNQNLPPIAPAPYPRHINAPDMRLHEQLPPHLRAHYQGLQQQQQQHPQQQFNRNLSIPQLSPHETHAPGSVPEPGISQAYQSAYGDESEIGEMSQQDRNPESPGFMPHGGQLNSYHDAHHPPYPHPRSNSDSFIPDQLSHTSSIAKTEPGSNSPPMASPLHHLPGRSHSFPSQTGNISPYQPQGGYSVDQPDVSPPGQYQLQIDPRLESMQPPSTYTEGQPQDNDQAQTYDEQQPGFKEEERDLQLISPYNYDASAETSSTHASSYYDAGEVDMTSNGHAPQAVPVPLAQVDEVLEEDDDDDDDIDDDVAMELMPRAAVSSLLEPHARVTDQARVSFRSFIPEEGVLATYVPSSSSSPLMNPITARIFVHWVYVLGPSVSIFERHPPNPHAAFTPGTRLNGPQNVWCYTVPMLALTNSLLLHALLALSSLHIAKLSGESLSASHVHYHLAVRRLRKAIQDDKKRSEVATLAATLLLAYYETMAADVHKWSNHVQGAKQLLREIDFDRVTRHVEVLEEEELSSGQSSRPIPEPDSTYQGNVPKRPRTSRPSAKDQLPPKTVDRYLLGAKASKRKDSKTGARGGTSKNEFGRKDLDTSQLQSDLFWWFAKMDAYQSMLSGNPLTLDYCHWGQCPPRSHIGTLGARTGSSDHLILLYGRIADFAVRDVQRKREVEKYGPAPAIIEMMRAKGPPPGGLGGPPGGPPTPGSGIRSPHSVGPPGGFNSASPPNFQYGGGSSSAATSPMESKHHRDSAGSASQFPTMASNFMTDANTKPPFTPITHEGGGPPQDHPQTASPMTNSSFPSPPHINREDLEVAGMEAELEWIEIRKALQLFQESLGEDFHPLADGLMPAQDSPFGNPIHYRTYAIACLQLLYKTAEIILERAHPSMPSNPMVAAGVIAKKTAGIANDIGRICASLLPPLDVTEISPSLGGAMIELTITMMVAGVQYVDATQRDWLVNNLMNVSRMTGWGTAERVVRGCQLAWQRAAQLGKGPPYTRPNPEIRQGEEGVINAEMSAGNSYTWQRQSTRVYFAVGILGDSIDP